MAVPKTLQSECVVSQTQASQGQVWGLRVTARVSQEISGPQREVSAANTRLIAGAGTDGGSGLFPAGVWGFLSLEQSPPAHLCLMILCLTLKPLN